LNFFSLFKRNLIYKIKKKIPINHDHLNNKSLDELFHFFGSDKANIFKKNNSKGHGYSNFYTNYLNHLKDKEINILEIGSYAGASAAAFVKYFPKAKIFCFDINISNFIYESSKIFVYGIDVNNEKRVKKILSKIFFENQFSSFDLIIDDGSHYLSDILFSLNFFFKYVCKNGIYVIEDFKLPNYYQYNKNINHILVDEFLKNLEKKTLFTSSIINQENQKYLMNLIDKIEVRKGNLKDSDICFIKKK
jgi:predicted O-methyltransferase YrrM|tara:strand:+ start:665 stop:1408 length:744 start_codon:yes stop_codon:yes gene_type:complete